MDDTVGQCGRHHRQASPERVDPDGEYPQALMDLGAAVCTSRKPLCLLCPLSSHCDALRGGLPRDRSPSAAGGSGREAPFVGSNRYYRGRILAALRAVGPGQGLAALALGQALKEGYGAEDGPWLERLLRGLERDGLVVCGGDGKVTEARLPG